MTLTLLMQDTPDGDSPVLGSLLQQEKARKGVGGIHT